MITATKLELAREAVVDHPLGPVLAALELPRSTWYYHQPPRPTYAERHAELRPILEEIAREHTEYGYRRTTTEVQEGYARLVNHKVIQKLHKLWGLPLVRSTHIPKPSAVRRIITAAGGKANLVAQLDAIEPFEVFYTDFTELRYDGGRQRAYLIAFPDHTSKLVVGWAVGLRANTELAIEAWESAVETLERFGRTAVGVIVHHDRDPVFTGYGWTGRLLLGEGARISYALHGARDNTAMESFNGRFKGENRSLIDGAQSLEALRSVLEERMSYFNRERRHSTLGNRSPLDILAERGYETTK
jgi:transposase InsO family protein